MRAKVLVNDREGGRSLKHLNIEYEVGRVHHPSLSRTHTPSQKANIAPNLLVQSHVALRERR